MARRFRKEAAGHLFVRRAGGSVGWVALRLVGEEALELRTQLVCRGEPRASTGEEVTSTAAADERVVLLLKGLDDRRDLGGGGDLLVDLFAGLLGG